MRWEQLDVRINQSGTVLCEPAWSWDSGILADFDLWYVWAGQGWIEWENQRHELTPGSLICLYPGRAYRARHDVARRLGVSFVHFDFVSHGGRVVKLAPSGRPPAVARVADADFFERLMKQIVVLHQMNGHAGYREAVNYLRGALAGLQRAVDDPPLHGTRKAHHDAIWTVARHIRENPGELFSIEALAESAGYSVDHFTRLFREIVGLTPKEFCIRARLQRAQLMLRESAMNVEQIADALGYADVFFFSRQFKQRLGMSPTRWRGQMNRC